jgi:DNA-binding PadR family transcriptional regulator
MTDRHADGTTPDEFDPCYVSTFQQVLLYVLFENARCGTELADRLESELAAGFHRNRVYTNLRRLAEKGLVEAVDTDGRTKRYRITDAGREWLRTRREWEFERSSRGE